MELSEYIETLRGEVASITRVAGEDVARAGQMIAEALDSSIRLTLLDVLSGAAAEITSRLDNTAIELRLSSGNPTFVVVHAPQELPPLPPPPAGPDRGEGEEETGTSRVTLRLPDGLKTRAEAAASKAGERLIGGTEVSFDGGTLTVEVPHRAHVRSDAPLDLAVELPEGSSIAVSTASADVSCTGELGSLQGRTASGDVTADRVGHADLTTASGDVRLREVTGDTLLHTASGDAVIQRADGDITMK